MSLSGARAAVAVCLLLAAVGAPADDRSTERFRYACSNALGRRDVTLFANGTVRLRQGLWQEQEMLLDELTPEELASYLERLEEIRSGAAKEVAPAPAETVGGEWVESCEIRLALAETPVWTHAFSPVEVAPLAVASLIHVAEDLASFTRAPEPPERLPADYRPRLGDVLRTGDGTRFEIVRWTLDQRGVELSGLDGPMQLFVAIGDLDEAFVAVEPPGSGGRLPAGPQDAAPASQPPGEAVRGMEVEDDEGEDGEAADPKGGGPARR